MKTFVPEAGQHVLFLIDNAVSPRWKECKVLAVSHLGYTLETDDGDFGTNAHWFDILGKGAHLRFRPLCEFWLRWEHKDTGELYEMIIISNQKTASPGFDPTITYKSVSSGDVFSQPAEDFYAQFKKDNTVQGASF